MILGGPPQGDDLRDADSIIYGDSEVKGAVNLTEDFCVVVARTVMVPLMHLSQAGKPAGNPMQPPAITIKESLREPRRALQMHQCFLRAERIRDYLAYSTGVAVPIRFVVAGKALLFPSGFDFAPQAYLPTEVLVGSKDFAGWAQGIEPKLIEAQRMLQEVVAYSPLDRAIDLVGRAITTTDRESSFLYCWRAIETVSAIDLEDARDRAKVGDVRAADPYIGPQLNQFLKGEEEILLSIAQRCFVSLQNRVPGFDIKKARGWYRLRGKVAHAGLTAEDYRDVLSAIPDVLRLATESVASKLADSKQTTSPVPSSG
jgi:hypothetical protein